MSGTRSGNRRGLRPYRRRKPVPALVLIAVLGVAAVAVWINALNSGQTSAEAMECQPRPVPPPDTTFTRLSHDALDDVEPIAPAKVPVRVLNANNTRGEATITTEVLRDLGFTSVGEPANDPAYPVGEANCHGQLRFGSGGERAARTVQLLDPCLELVRDGRDDNSVDLAIGTEFGDIAPSDEATEILDQLRGPAPDVEAGAAGRSTADHGGRIDPELLDAIGPEHC